MKVILDFENGKCIVKKTDGDKNFHTSTWSLAESNFLYKVKQEIQKMGYDVIKKRMYKDGHMVDDTQQYIRTRSWNGKDGEFCIYNTNYSLFDAGLIFNKDNEIELSLIVG
jgi:hypothetical protein